MLHRHPNAHRDRATLEWDERGQESREERERGQRKRKEVEKIIIVPNKKPGAHNAKALFNNSPNEKQTNEAETATPYQRF